MCDAPLPFDEPTAQVRQGEELDRRRLTEFLATQVGPSDHELEVAQFPAGYSNLTYLVRWGNQSYVLRRPPVGNKVKSAHDMSREFRVLSQLAGHYDVAPKPVAFTDDASILGAPFYLMERVRGTILRKVDPNDAPLDATILQELCANFAVQFARLHQLDYNQLGLGDLGRPDGYIERQVGGWTKRFAAAATEPLADIEFLAGWLADNMPRKSRCALIHNDFKFDNLVLDSKSPSRIVAVLDWEMATLGDPLMDLGSTLAYWVESKDSDNFRRWSFGPTELPGAVTRRELATAYFAASEDCPAAAADELLFYYAYGLFKLAGIVQQIYARYHHGKTQDPRFAHLNQMVADLGQQARNVINRGEI